MPGPSQAELTITADITEKWKLMESQDQQVW